jgi:hypothetical protein
VGQIERGPRELFVKLYKVIRGIFNDLSDFVPAPWRQKKKFARDFSPRQGDEGTQIINNSPDDFI